MTRVSRWRLGLTAWALFLTPLTLPAADWLHWRGPEQNGVSREKDLPDKWSPDEKAANNNLLWKAPYGCRSAPLVQGNHVYLINSAGTGYSEGERVLCLDADTGKLLWENKFNVFLSDVVSSRVGWTNLAGDPETGNVYAHGTQGFLQCYSKDGKLLWQRSLTEEYGRITGYGGRLTSPIVDGDLVIIGMVQSSWGDFARGGNRFVAFNKKTGEVVWWSEPGGPIKGTYYSNPVVAVINGRRLLISGAADGSLVAMDVRTGNKVWSYPFGAAVINASPVVQGTKIYCSHGEENTDTSTQGRVICIDAGKLDAKGNPTLVWEEIGVKAGYTSPIIHDNDLFVCTDSGRLLSFDATTGEKRWEHAFGRLARGSPVWADGKIYVADVNARFHTLQPSATGCKSLHSQFFPGTGGTFVETNGSPAIANGRIYFGTRDDLYCIAKKDSKAKADPIPAQPAESKAKPDAPIAHLQVLPADVVIAPGESVQFKVLAFDADGHFIKEVKDAEWSRPEPVPPPNSNAKPPPFRGEVTKDGKATADKIPTQQGYVAATVGKVTGRARVRVVSPLPVKYDFSKVPEGATPGGWVNAQGKYAIAKAPDGTLALKKLANDSRPPLARANGFLNLPTLSDYTIQADILGKQKGENLPDMGLTNCRYTLIFDGNKQQLRIVSWEALPRVDKSIPFKWQGDVWYRTKFTVEPGKDKAIIRGKVWPRDKEEPSAWTIEFEDPSPNREGAPAVYGYVLGIVDKEIGTEIFYNNVSVTPNAKK